MKQSNLGLAARLTPLFLLAFAACDSRTGSVGEATINEARMTLESVNYGRLVDVYAYQRIDTARADRRDRFNRRPVLVATDVVVNPSINSQSLFDAGGQEVPGANYEFLPFDIDTGHEELMILWDNRGDESDQFDAALSAARNGLPVLPDSYRGQNTNQRTIPVVPRNAAFLLNFSSPISADSDFFVVNQSAVQLLEFKGDPQVVSPVDAFRTIPYRAIASGRQLVLDTTILGGVATGGVLSRGMPASSDLVTANIRIAIPARGAASRAFQVNLDEVAELNGDDSQGRLSVIRDFRSGNQQDGTQSLLRDLNAPMIVGEVPMGIMEVNNDVVQLNKRNSLAQVRGRYPFVEGAIDSSTGYPLGAATVPTAIALPQADFLRQTVRVQMPDGQFEDVEVRAEILENLEVGTIRGDGSFPGVGLAADGTLGESLPVVRVRVGNVRGVDSLGRPVGFAGSTVPTGADCTLRTTYYDNIPFGSGGQVVSDASRRYEFLRIDPAPPTEINGIPVAPGTRIPVNASLAIEFSEPMDFESIDNTTNLVVTLPTMPNQLPSGEAFADLINEPKIATHGVVPTRLTDQSGDGTVLQLQPPQGFYHIPGTAEPYWFHVLLGNKGFTDFAGNRVEIFSDVAQNVRNWSVQFELDRDAGENLVGWKLFRFEDIDEDGTPAGSIDIFGQFRIIDGKLMAAETVRFSRTADAVNLGAISRSNRGECWDTAADTNFPLLQGLPGTLYWTPTMIDTVNPPNVPTVYLPPNSPQPVGQVIEPHQPRGSRLMMRYVEDDFSLSYRQPAEFAIDVEQLYWTPFNNQDILFDVFDRYTMRLSHTDRRPDVRYIVDTQADPIVCTIACASVSSSLSTTFMENVLPGSEQKTVFQDKVYTINPNNAFLSNSNFKYIAYPRFDRSYTWRDSRLVTKDENGEVVGLGGARDPGAPAPNDDFTANIDSPWIDSEPDPGDPLANPPQPGFAEQGFTTWVMDAADFCGDRQRDHDPIALPLLVDFLVFPDSAANGLANGANGFQMAMISAPSGFSGNPPAPGGYYGITPLGCANRDNWPNTRIHTTGGLDPSNNQDILVNPATQEVAQGGWIKDSGAVVITGAGVAGNGPLGIFRAPPADPMINWAQADFVRKVSTMTFGFFDTLQPNLSTAGGGTPDYVALAGTVGNVAIQELITQMDPPQAQQPAGTQVVVEFRGAQNFANSDVLYDPGQDDTVPDPVQGGPTGRGNLLNPNYSCEAYRYDQPNSGPAFDTPRVDADGLTAYVTEDRLDRLRRPNGLLPRFMNLRLVMTNNVDVTPALSPALRSMAVIYRMGRQQ